MQLLGLAIGTMVESMLRWLRRLQGYDLEGTALSFLLCQVALAIVATGAWLPNARLAVLLFLPTVLLAGFFLRLVDGVPLLLAAFLATWYYIVPPVGSFALTPSGAVELALFVGCAALLILGLTGLRRILQRSMPESSDRRQPSAGSMHRTAGNSL